MDHDNSFNGILQSDDVIGITDIPKSPEYRIQRMSVIKIYRN